MRYPSFLKRQLIALLLALPLSLLLATVVWRGDHAHPLNWWERMQTIGIFLSVSGSVIAILLSGTHTWLARRGALRTRTRSFGTAAGIGLVLGSLTGASWSREALLSLAAWGVSLGLLYAVAIMVLDPGLQGGALESRVRGRG